MREIALTPYGGTLFYTDSRSKFRKQRKRLTGKAGEKITSAGLTYWITDGNHQVWLVYADETPTLAHELTHVVLFLFKHVGINPFEANGEPMAYMVGSLMERCLER